MLIGNLPETTTAEDSDHLILSKDNANLLKITKEQLMKGYSKEGSPIKYPDMSVNEWAAFKTPSDEQVYGKTVSVELLSAVNTLANITGAHYVGYDSKFSFIEKTVDNDTIIYNFPAVIYSDNDINYAQIYEGGDTGLFEIEVSEFFIGATATVTIYYTKD